MKCPLNISSCPYPSCGCPREKTPPPTAQQIARVRMLCDMLIRQSTDGGASLAAVLAHLDAQAAEIARLREALEAIVNTGDDCPACDRGVLRRQEKGHWPECPFGKATDALTGRTPLEDSADGA